MSTDGTKMSKSKGNVVDPAEIINNGYGVDALRVLIVFLAPYDMTTPWNESGIAGTFRFLQRVWTICQEHLAEAENRKHKAESEKTEELKPIVHKAIKRVTKDMHELGFNTAVAALMELVNDLYKLKLKKPLGSDEWQLALSTTLQLVAPFAPHIAEELWQEMGNKESVHLSQWPVHDDRYLVSETMIIVVQVNGKVRANLTLPVDSTEEEIKKAAEKDEKIVPYVKDQKILKTVYVPGKLVNFVIKD